MQNRDFVDRGKPPDKSSPNNSGDALELLLEIFAQRLAPHVAALLAPATPRAWVIAGSTPVQQCPEGYTARTICELARDGRLRATRTPKGWRFDADALAEFEAAEAVRPRKKRGPPPKPRVEEPTPANDSDVADAAKQALEKAGVVFTRAVERPAAKTRRASGGRR